MRKTKAEIIAHLQDQLLTEEQLREESAKSERKSFEEMKKALKAKANWFRLYRRENELNESLRKDNALWKRKFSELEHKVGMNGFFNKLLFLIKRHK